MDATTDAAPTGSSHAAPGAILAPMDVAEPLRAYGSKAERIYDALRLEFVHGAWPFGQTFTTYELAERFGVSRRPVMDAVQRLQSDGFVEVIPQVGCRVVVPDERRLHDHLELSMILEPPAARMAAERATPADVDRLERIHERATPIVESGDALADESVPGLVIGARPGIDEAAHRGLRLPDRRAGEAHRQQIVAGAQREQRHRHGRYAQTRINCGPPSAA